MYLARNFDSGVLPTRQDGNAILGPTYDFLKDCLKQYYFANQAEISAAPRLRAYLAQRSTVDKFRRLIVQRNSAIREYDVYWKAMGKTFIESLPELPS